jgi:2,3-bisphosphoglycerate-independent phosphoglycerate mutase
MKFALLVGDGMADYALDELGGLTPLEAAATPNMDAVAREGTVGTVRTIPDGMQPGSDIANLNLLGYDVRKYYSGRAPLEAASMGIELAAGHAAFRCNLVTVEDGVMVDYSAGHITSEEAAPLIEAVDAKLGREGLRFYSGVSYRHLMIAAPGEGTSWDSDLHCTPPHDIVGKPIAEHLPSGKDSETLRELMSESAGALSGHAVNRARIESGKRPADMIWFWGEGYRPSMPTFDELYGLGGSVISAVDLIRGMGKYAGLSVVKVPGATGYFDTNYEGKGKYGVDVLREQDFLFMHVEAPDEAGHVGDVEEKVKAIEMFDKLVVGPIVEELKSSGEYRALVLPDHLTPISLRTHVSDPVPYAVCGTGIACGGASAYSEAEAEKHGDLIENGFELLPSYLKV